MYIYIYIIYIQSFNVNSTFWQTSRVHTKEHKDKKLLVWCQTSNC